MFGIGKNEGVPEEEAQLNEGQEKVLEEKEVEGGTKIEIVSGPDGEKEEIETTPVGGDSIDGEKLEVKEEEKSYDPYDKAA